MREQRWASAVFALTWLAGAASAQQSVPGALPSPASALPPADAAAPNTAESDDPTDDVNWRDRVAAAKRRHSEWAACVAARQPGCSDSDAPLAPDPMEPLLNDETLVNGDIVSTPSGLKVFRGQSTIPHSLADFQ
jgi:hypothetical protein